MQNGLSYAIRKKSLTERLRGAVENLAAGLRSPGEKIVQKTASIVTHNLAVS